MSDLLDRADEATAATEVDSEPAGAQSSGGPTAALIGRVLGRFRVVGRIGQGGLGEVYLAEQELLAREAVIKIIRQDRRMTASRAERFLREAKLAARLDHPYAAHVYAFGAEPDGLLWIAMERVRGPTLAELVKRRGPMPVDAFAPLCSHLCEVVHAAHELGIVHRDLKPSNVMVVTSGGRLLPKLLDFGVAKSLDLEDLDPDSGVHERAAGLTRDDQVLGSPAYMAPEQWANPRDVDRRADIYALGCLSFFALTGRPPFSADRIEDMAVAHMEYTPPQLTGVPGSIERAVRRSLAKEPDDRYATALDFATDLDAASIDGGRPPPLDPTMVTSYSARAPEPIARLIVALASTRSIGEADALLGTTVDALVRWLSILALALSRNPAVEGAQHLGRQLWLAGLTTVQWLELAETVVAADEDHPLAAQLDAARAAGLKQLARPRQILPPGSALEERLRGEVDALTAVLATVEPIMTAPVVSEIDGEVLLLSGVERRPVPSLWAVPVGAGDVAVLLEGTERPVLLSPYVAARSPLPGAEPELFVLASSSHGPCLRALPSGAECGADEALQRLAETLDLTREDTDEGGDLAAPYLGLSPFGPSDAGKFVGRERQVESFLNLLRSRRLIGLVGASGAGKSSFLHAGVLSSLPAGWRAITMRPGHNPIEALLGCAGVDEDIHGPVDQIAEALVQRARQDGTLVLAVDQGEELFALGATSIERERFAEILTRATMLGGGNVRVVLCMRDDFLARAEALPAFRGRLASSIVVLVTPAPEDLRRIVMEPARRAGYQFEDPTQVDEMIAAIADRPGGLALLAFTALAWWERREQKRRILPARAYRDIGGVAGALASHAEALYAALPKSGKRAAREVVRHLVTAEGTRAAVPASDLSELAGPGGAEAIDAMIAGRLLVARDDQSGDVVELAHEALIDGWPLLRRIREEDAADARIRDDLRTAARGWDERGHRSDELWRGRALADLERFRARVGVRLTAIEDRFADASLAAARRTRRRRQMAVAVALAVLGAATVFLALAERSARRSQSRAQNLAQRAVRGESQAQARLAEMWVNEGRREIVSGSSLRAMTFLGAAYGIVDGPGLRFALARGMESIDAGAVFLRGHDTGVSRVMWSPDGRYLAVNDGNFGVTLWRVRDGRPERVGELPAEIGRIGGFTGDGSELLVDTRKGPVYYKVAALKDSRAIEVGKDFWFGFLTEDGNRMFAMRKGVVELRDTKGAVRKSVELPDFDPMYIVPSRSGHRVVMSSEKNRAFVLVDFEAGTVTRLLGPELKLELAYSEMTPDGKYAAVAATTGTTYFFDLDQRRLLHRLNGHSARHTVTISDDGKLVATGSTDRTGKLWDGTSGQLIATLTEHRGPIARLAFDSRSSFLVTTSGDGAVRIFSPSGALLASYEGHAADALEVEISPDGQFIATGGADGNVILWPTDSTSAQELMSKGRINKLARCGDNVLVGEDTTASLRNLDGQVLQNYDGGEEVITVACSTDSKRVVLGTSKAARLFDIEGRQIARLSHGGDGVPEVMMSRDGKTIATIGFTGEMGVWQAQSGLPVRKFMIDPKNVVYPTSVDFSVDDQKLFIGDSTGMVSVWQIEDGAMIEGARVHDGRVAFMAVSPDGSQIVTASTDRAVSIIDSKTLRTQQTLDEHQAILNSLDWSPDGKLIVTGSEDPSAYVWEASSGDLVGAVRPGLGGIAGAVFIGDRVLAASRGGRLMSYPADREQRPPDAVRAILSCRVPYRLGEEGGDLVRTSPEESCADVGIERTADSP